ELVATWGNLVNRVVSMTHRYFDGVVPEPGPMSVADDELLAEADATLAEVGSLIEAVRLRAGLQRAMAGAQAVNVYLNEMEPWKTAKTDEVRTGTTLSVALSAISGLAAALAPYLPFTSRKVLEGLGIDVPEAGPRWGRGVIEAGALIAEPEPLFTRVESLENGDG
ncbi:MAG: class I tRNA ligase family protein, partial [Actinomycetota bacterium]|nr:class I tRNA ligase family protein [Actinomycetota bacterium]